MFAKDYRRIARENLQGNWKLSIGTALIACMLGGMIVGTIFFPEFQIRYEGQNIRNLTELLSLLLSNSGLAVAGTLNLLHLILGGVVQLGFAKYLLKQHDRQEPQFNDLFSMFDYFGAGFCQAFLRGLYTFLWSLLLIIPGIIAGLSYSMTPFIMAEDPELTASEAIRRSKEMMNGHKWELFCLNFSFFGWGILCALTANIGYIALNPYMNAAYAAFYRQISRPTPSCEL